VRSVLPALPQLDPAVTEASDVAHHAVHVRVEALDADVGRLVRRIVWRRLVEAVANVGAIEFDEPAPRILLPPRRRLLSSGLDRRLAGSELALRHLDSRLYMARSGTLDHVVARETPMVLNAFAEGIGAGDVETNAGSIRVGPTSFRDDGVEFVPPPAEHCRELLDEMVEVVRSRPPVHHLEVAAWSALVMFAVHPFVDGNGRTARLMFQAIHSAGLPGRFDLGSIEEWSAERRRYIDVLQRATAPCPVGRVDGVDVTVFAEFAAACSIAGARRTAERIEHIGASVDRWRSQFGSATITYAFVAFERNVSPAELGEVGDEREQRAIAEDLCAAGVLRRDRMGRYAVT
jgi:hypothetical protein